MAMMTEALIDKASICLLATSSTVKRACREKVEPVAFRNLEFGVVCGVDG